MRSLRGEPEMSDDRDEAAAWALALRFQKEWNPRLAPDLYLDELPPGSGARRIAVVHLCQIDLELRWKEGQKPRADEYFGRLSRERGDDRIAAMELIESEYQHRREHFQRECRRVLDERAVLRNESTRLLIESFCQGYPAYGEELALQLKRSFPIPPLAEPTERFQVLREYESGGLGVISLARDQELHRDVALKRIKEQNCDDPEIRRRFLLEAETTGNLEHPGIVPVYGLGYDRDGSPFYAMRFIQGTRLKDEITRFHEASGRADRGPGERILELHKLLRRILDVCNTVSYAHSRGLVHRDLKPGNIMLGLYGETLVLDWGLVKVIGRHDSASTGKKNPLSGLPLSDSDGTLIGTVLGTVVNMSPEQATGDLEAIGPASDVYSLGTILYCLLTGREAFEGKPEEILEKVKRGDYPPPRDVDRRVPPALAAICKRAMALKPDDRYESVRALAEDIEHWLADEPVSTWHEPLKAQARRWARRNRAAATGVAAAAIAGVLGLFTVLGVQTQAYTQLKRANLNLKLANHEAQSARDRAENHVELALRAIEHFHRSVSQNLDVQNRPDLQSLRRELLEAPLKFYAELKSDLSADAEGRTEAALQYAQAIMGLAAITALVGSEPDAIAAYQDAIQVLERLSSSGQQPTIDRARRIMALAYMNLAILEGAASKTAPALACSERSRDLYRRLVADHPADEAYQYGLAQVENICGQNLRDERRIPEALGAYTQARDRVRALVEAHPATNEYRSLLAVVLTKLGVLARAKDQIAQAKQSYEEAITLFEVLIRDQPENVKHRRGLASVSYNLGSLYGINLPGLTEAKDYLEKARDLQQALVKEHPSVGEYRADLAKTFGQIGAVLKYHVAPEESLASFERARELLEGLSLDHPTITRYRGDLAMTEYHIGDRQLEAKRPAQALISFDKALTLSEPLILESPKNVFLKQQLFVVLNGRGSALAALKRFQESAEAYERAISVSREAYDGSASYLFRREVAGETITAHEELIKIWRVLNQPEKALRVTCSACEFIESFPSLEPPDHLTLAALYSQASGEIGRRGPGLSVADAARQEAYAGRAIAALRRWMALGHARSGVWQDNRAFDPLRGRADFQALMMDLAMPDEPFASKP
jgi:tetratricopeptide (TPR) repeat protein/tRNA A-37 threonylcarbamoyl transferase component Bud32